MKVMIKHQGVVFEFLFRGDGGIFMERNDKLIRKKIYKYMLTGVLTTMALQLGNVVDAMIVGNLLGSIGNAAVSASLPYTYILQAATILLASGGAVISAVLLGKRDAVDAGKIMTFCFVAGIAYSLVFVFAAPVTVPFYVQFTLAEGVLKEMIADYSFVYTFGMPVIFTVLLFSYFMNADSHPSFSAGMNATANAVNLLFDFLIVKFTTLGIKGAALSTVIGYVVAGLIFIPRYMHSDNRMLKFSVRGLWTIKGLIGAALKRGAPNLIYLILTVVGMSIMNSAILSTLGTGYYSAYAVANNTQNIVQMFLNGISSVIASVAGVLYGEKDYFGMRIVLSRVLKTAFLTGAVIMAVFLTVPQVIAFLYGMNDPVIMPELLTGLRVFSLSFGFFILNAISQNYYRTTGQTFLTTVSTVLQLLVIKIPAMLFGMRFYGFIGLFAAIIISELCSFLMLNVIRIVMQKLGKVPQKGFMAVPEKNEAVICDLSVTGSDEQAVSVSERIIDYCINYGLSPKKAKMLGLGAEEIVSNIGKYGYKNRNDRDIDVCLSHTNGRYYLRIRDDGIPFDPTAYVPQEDENSKTGGLELLKKLSINMTYMRVISLNNTIFEIGDEEGVTTNE